MAELQIARVDLVMGERVEHEGIVGVRTVADVDDAFGHGCACYGTRPHVRGDRSHWPKRTLVGKLILSIQASAWTTRCVKCSSTVLHSEAGRKSRAFNASFAKPSARRFA